MLDRAKKSSLIKNSLLSCISSFAALFSICNNALALPFKSNVAAFETYANTRTWTDGNQRVFSQLYNCSFRGRHKSVYSGLENEYDSARCANGYLTVYSPQGTKVCELKYPGLQYERVLMDDGVPVNREGKIYFGVQNCVTR
jgi:hypothetical protein